MKNLDTTPVAYGWLAGEFSRPGGDIGRRASLDCYCAEIGREPTSITRSIHPSVSHDQPRPTRHAKVRRLMPASGMSTSDRRPPFQPMSHGGVPDELIITSV
jgi:hypothetical protein